ncbi:glycoside hydrolase family 127 protein [Alteromonas sp. NFXS44]|uniref:glycoside hydrolase family 127 protein n=1 Tax=Alteromonas sp. NFXS44 TaxID=2818435 RepID=UPI0032DE4920
MAKTTPVFWRTLLCAAISAALLSGCGKPSQTTSAQKEATETASATVIHEVSKQQLDFPLAQVQVTDGPFLHAQQTNVKYIMAMDPDRLLAPYLKEAGLKPKAENYGNWENTGLDGHIGGHYLSALSLAWAATGSSQIKDRLDYMLSELARAQKATGGYLGGIPDGKAMWDEIRNGEIKADLFSLNDRWVPLYNIDKIFHGLRDAYQIGGSEQAKRMLLASGEWMLSVTDSLSDEQIQQMLYSEHGGLNEVFGDMALISRDPRYLKLAKQFSHQRILTPLEQKTDQLTGLHANTQIPKVIGFLKVAEVSDNKAWEDAADFFWATVSKERSVTIGGNSVREHFHDKADFTPMVEDVEGPETCNTYNMMKLSKMLYLRTGEARYLAFYERAMYNHILSSQHPDHGGLVYFTPMRPGHYRMYSSVQDSMWCCVGSGIENHSKYGELAYTHKDDALWINLFLPSQLNWQEQGWTITQQTQFPDDNNVTVTLNAGSDAKPFTLNIRKPGWLTDNMAVKVNGEAVDVAENEGFITLTGPWKDGDVISFSLPAKPYVEQLPDGQDYYSILYGPVVLATKVQAFANEKLNFVADDSRMGHIASGQVCPPEALPVMLGDPDTFLAGLKRVQDAPLSFVASENIAIANKPDVDSVTLIPFFRLHDSRYEVYMPQLSEAGFSAFVENAKAQAAEKEALREITVDTINPGEQQPEVEHNFRGEQTRAGVNNGNHWRDATAWFSYELKNPEKRAKTLRLTYFKGDQNRRFRILINGETLATVDLPVHASEEDLYQVDYPLPVSLQNAEVLTLKFEAEQDSVAGGLYGIRLISE